MHEKFSVLKGTTRCSSLSGHNGQRHGRSTLQQGRYQRKGHAGRFDLQGKSVALASGW